MMKSSSILLFISLHHIYAHPGDKDNRYEPLMSLAKARNPVVKTFSFGNTQFLDHDSAIGKYMCPAETDEDVSNMEQASRNNYTLKYCLFTKKFQKNEERFCKKEVKPVFNEILDQKGNTIKCGVTQYQTMHEVSYHECGDLDVLKKFQNESVRKNSSSYKFTHKMIYLYDICYDSVEKSVLWTMHHIQTPQLFQNPYFQNQRKLLDTEISTDSYFMDADLFQTIKRHYEMEKLKDTSKPDTFVMVPRPLVPAEHYSLPMLRKFTHHYINMAPLWDNLVPLMTAIDQGIKQAQMNLESSDPEWYNDLIINTAVIPTKEFDHASKTWFNLLLFEGNTWCKLIYRTEKQSAVLIIIHNTPGNPPAPLAGCLVGKQRGCNFQTWSKDKEIHEHVTFDDLKYAFCCEVGVSDIQGVFTNDFRIEEYLDIDSLITKSEEFISKPNNSEDPFDMKFRDDQHSIMLHLT